MTPGYTRVLRAASRWPVVLVLLLWLSPGSACSYPADPGGPWTADEALAPADLAATLRGSGTKPTIVYVGFRALYRPGHIPGATFRGPASDAAGMAELRQWAASQPRDAPLVVYCGCCPFEQCPNIVPAYRALRELGFTKIRVLILPTSFEVDWVEKGLPTER